jgi:hypothetical protein
VPGVGTQGDDAGAVGGGRGRVEGCARGEVFEFDMGGLAFLSKITTRVVRSVHVQFRLCMARVKVSVFHLHGLCLHLYHDYRLLTVLVAKVDREIGSTTPAVGADVPAAPFPDTTPLTTFAVAVARPPPLTLPKPMWSGLPVLSSASFVGVGVGVLVLITTFGVPPTLLAFI